MVLIGMLAVAGGLRLLTPLVERTKVAIELQRPGMSPYELGGHPSLGYLDGIWALEEMPAVQEAVAGGDQYIMKVGKQRWDTLIAGGAQHCTTCRKLFLDGDHPPSCPRCGNAKFGGKGA